MQNRVWDRERVKDDPGLLWRNREQRFAAFATGELLTFWQQRETRVMTGVAGAQVYYVRFFSSLHDQVILISPGRTESFAKYAELAYDLFHCGFDVIIIDHRGQGLSSRLLDDPQCGHVEQFNDYVDDLETLYLREIAGRAYQRCFALGHSMGGTILSLLLLRQPHFFDAVTLVAPMFGIVLPLSHRLARVILRWAEASPARRNRYAVTTGPWRPSSFDNNVSTHSAVRHRYIQRLYADAPALALGGPSYHWVSEALTAASQVVRDAQRITTPLLVLQAGEDVIVDNQAQNIFMQQLQQNAAMSPVAMLKIITRARHEILLETDNMRVDALETLVAFFSCYR